MLFYNYDYYAILDDIFIYLNSNSNFEVRSTNLIVVYVVTEQIFF